MIARISTYKKAEEELLQLDAAVRGKFYDFCHRFRQNPDHPGLDLKPLKGDGRVFRAKLNQSYRVLLGQTGVDSARSRTGSSSRYATASMSTRNSRSPSTGSLAVSSSLTSPW